MPMKDLVTDVEWVKHVYPNGLALDGTDTGVPMMLSWAKTPIQWSPDRTILQTDFGRDMEAWRITRDIDGNTVLGLPVEVATQQERSMTAFACYGTSHDDVLKLLTDYLNAEGLSHRIPEITIKEVQLRTQPEITHYGSVGEDR